MTAAAGPSRYTPGRGLPVLGVLSTISRVALIATIVASLLATCWILGCTPTRT